jgi:uncharacterized RDD family membrane protein YckC
MTSAHPVEHIDGVFYARRDCAGFLRRAISGAIDAGVVWLLWVLNFNVVLAFRPTEEVAALAIVIGLPGMGFLYFVVMKRSQVRTVGYRMTGLKVVNLRGSAPSVLAMTLRICVVIWLAWPFGVFDFLYMFGDERRRKLSDVLAGTCVVRTRAQPYGTGEVVSAVSFIYGHTYHHRELRRSETRVPCPSVSPVLTA